MVNLAAEAEAAIREAQGAPERLRVAATSTVAEFVAPPLLAAFTARATAVEANVGVSLVRRDGRPAAGAAGRRLLRPTAGRRVGERTRLRADDALQADRRGFPDPPPGRVRAHPVGRWPREDWLVDPCGSRPFVRGGHAPVPAGSVRQSASGSSRARAAAWSAAAEGEGVAPGHLPPGSPRPRPWRPGAASDVVSTPFELLWYVSTPSAGTAVTGASTCCVGSWAHPRPCRACTAATAAVPASRFRPPVYVTLWS